MSPPRTPRTPVRIEFLGLNPGETPRVIVELADGTHIDVNDYTDAELRALLNPPNLSGVADT